MTETLSWPALLLPALEETEAYGLRLILPFNFSLSVCVLQGWGGYHSRLRVVNEQLEAVSVHFPPRESTGSSSYDHVWREVPSTSKPPYQTKHMFLTQNGLTLHSTNHLLTNVGDFLFGA